MRHKFIVMLYWKETQPRRRKEWEKTILCFDIVGFINKRTKNGYWLAHKAALKVKCCVQEKKDVYSTTIDIVTVQKYFQSD